MAEYNLIQNPLLISRLQSRLGIRGQRSLAPTMAETVQPVVVVDDLTETTSTTPRLFSGGQIGIGTGASAGPTVSLQHPSGSGVIVRVRRIIIAFADPSQIGAVIAEIPVVFGPLAATLDFDDPGTLLSQTSGAQTRSICRVQGGEGVTPPSPFLMFFTYAYGPGAAGPAVPIDVELPGRGIILRVNSSLAVHKANGGVGNLAVTFFWEEEDASLTP